MPTSPPRHCNGCGSKVPTGERCPCRPAWSKNNPGSRRRNGSTRRSRCQRAAMLAEQPMCATGCGRLAAVDDHIRAIAEGGDLHDPANRQGLCLVCTDEKTQAEAARGRAQPR